MYSPHHYALGQAEPTHLGDGVEGVPALQQDLGVGVVEQADEAREQVARVGAVVQAGAGEVAVEDGDGGLPEAGVGAPRGLQQVVYDDALAHLVLHREDHRLTALQLLRWQEATQTLMDE